MHNFDGKGLSLTQTNSEKEFLKISAQLDKSCSKYLFLVNQSSLLAHKWDSLTGYYFEYFSS